MAGPVPVEVLETSVNRTTTEVLTTGAMAVDDTLVVFYGSDFFTVSGADPMPDITVSGETVGAPLRIADIGDNLGHLKAYVVPITTPGVKNVTIPAHSGCDIHGHVLRYTGQLLVDDHDGQINAVQVNPHPVPSLDSIGADRSLVACWLTIKGPNHTGDAYVPPVAMTKLSETGAPNFSTSMVAHQSVGAGATGTRSASWEPDGTPTVREYAGIDLLLASADDFRTGEISIPVTVSASLAGTKTATGAISASVSVGSSLAGAKSASGSASHPVTVSAIVAGQDMGGAPVSDVLCSPWATPADIPEQVKADLGLTDAELLGPLLRASEILWALSGRRWLGGGCEEQAVLRSIPPRIGEDSWPYEPSWGACGCWVHAEWINGLPVNVLHSGLYHARQPFAVRLPRGAITAVTLVEIGGDPFTAWTFTPSGWLERIDGAPWPVCGGEVEVTYQYGEAPPAGGRDATVVLGVELAKDMLGRECALPSRTTSVTRQNVTIEMASSIEVLRESGTGIYSVDLWLKSVNPEARPQRAGVWSPDVPRLSRRIP